MTLKNKHPDLKKWKTNELVGLKRFNASYTKRRSIVCPIVLGTAVNLIEGAAEVPVDGRGLQDE